MQVDTMLIWDIEEIYNYINFDIGLFYLQYNNRIGGVRRLQIMIHHKEHFVQN
jgi:hypothetical protein